MRAKVTALDPIWRRMRKVAPLAEAETASSAISTTVAMKFGGIDVVRKYLISNAVVSCQLSKPTSARHRLLAHAMQASVEEQHEMSSLLMLTIIFF